MPDVGLDPGRGPRNSRFEPEPAALAIPAHQVADPLPLRDAQFARQPVQPTRPRIGRAVRVGGGTRRRHGHREARIQRRKRPERLPAVVDGFERVGRPAQDQEPRVHQRVAGLAERDQVLRDRLPALRPVSHVVHRQHVGALADAAGEAVTLEDLEPQPARRGGRPLVEGDLPASVVGIEDLAGDLRGPRLHVHSLCGPQRLARLGLGQLVGEQHQEGVIVDRLSLPLLKGRAQRLDLAVLLGQQPRPEPHAGRVDRAPALVGRGLPLGVRRDLFADLLDRLAQRPVTPLDVGLRGRHLGQLARGRPRELPVGEQPGDMRQRAQLPADLGVATHRVGGLAQRRGVFLEAAIPQHLIRGAIDDLRRIERADPLTGVGRAISLAEASLDLARRQVVDQLGVDPQHARRVCMGPVGFGHGTSQRRHPTSRH